MRETPDVLDIEWPEASVLTTHKAYDPSNPFPYFQFMRDHAPVTKARTPQGDLYLISRFFDVQKAMRDPKLFSNAVVKLDKFR